MFKRKKHNSGGFVLVEFAIALPLLILLGCGLSIVGVKIFQLGKTQLADYVLENEAQYVIERITHQARAAKKVIAENESNKVELIYHVADNDKYNSQTAVADVLETQYIYTYRKAGRNYPNLYATRQYISAPHNPITGENFFGDTKVISLKFAELDKNVLHVSLEMESLVTGRKIKIDTAVFMPSCEELTIQ